jgi:hypothetical protein
MELNSPGDLSGSGVLDDEPVPDWFSAGADTRVYEHITLRRATQSSYDRMYARCSPRPSASRRTRGCSPPPLHAASVSPLMPYVMWGRTTVVVRDEDGCSGTDRQRVGDSAREGEGGKDGSKDRGREHNLRRAGGTVREGRKAKRAVALDAQARCLCGRHDDGPVRRAGSRIRTAPDRLPTPHVRLFRVDRRRRPCERAAGELV